MSSLRNAVQRRAHKERAQPKERKRFGLLEKHKDYVVRAKAFHKKEDYLQKLKEKAANRNPDEFYFKMINSKPGDSDKYTEEELLLMKTQDIGYILQKLQAEKKKIERLTATLHSLDSQPSNKHEDAKRILSETKSVGGLPAFEDLPESIKRKTASSYRQLEDRKNRVQELEKVYNEMALKQELRKKGKKRKLREDEIVFQLLDQYTSGEPNVNVKLRYPIRLFLSYLVIDRTKQRMTLS
ncbi:putative small-subunit processome, Utp11 protein [Helianthus annuus]|nr:putative small-subunit processome, Utp11 protein [Helianthus annuus]